MDEKAASLHADALLWDQHGCLPLHPDAVDELELYRRAGVDLVSINVGMDLTPTVDAFKVVAAFPAGVKAHARNVSDAQLRACAATGGVVGINGLGIFLGDNDASTEALVRAVDYAVGVVGAEHVGLGLDYVFDQDELRADLEQHPDVFPADGGYAGDLPQFVSPLQLPELTTGLLRLGYSEPDVRAILGGNFRRVASVVWH